MKKTRVKVLRGNKQQIEGDLALKKEKMYILKDKELRIKIIWLYHSILAARYGGR